MIKILFWAIVAAVALILLVLALSALLVDPRKEYTKNSPYYRTLLDISTMVGIKLLRIHVTINGREKLPQNTRFLLVSNHRSNFDPIVTWYALREQKIAFVSKPENFQIPVFGRIIHKCCFLPIDRENPRKAIVTINRAAKLLKKQEVSIGVYPEGTRSKTCELLPFHNGVFKIAQKADVPIVVLSITGTEKIAKATPFRRTDVYLDVLEVFSNIKETKTELIGTAARRLMETNIERRERLWQKDM